MATSDIISGLTPDQKAAVTTSAHETLVIAPAGSGKTRVLTKRAAWLIDQGADPASIMLLTFTRKAALEMKTRLAHELGDARDLEPLMLGTFHSVSLDILNRFGGRIGYRNAEKLAIYDDDDSLLVLEVICRDLGYLDPTTMRWKEGLSGEKIRRYREAIATRGGELVGGFEANTLRALRQIYAEYRSRLKQDNAMDFGLILSETLALLNSAPEVLEYYTSRIKHVLVDEIQDADSVQHTLHNVFAPPASFFAVGDRRQAIYSFRGSRPDLMVTQRPNARIINLLDNFRSGSKIVQAANQLIAENHDTAAPPMRSASGTEGHTHSVRTSLAGVAAEISNLAMDGYAPGDIAILARTHEQLRDLEPDLAMAQIPYKRIGADAGLVSTREFKRVQAAMRLIVEPLSRIAFLRLLGDLNCDSRDYARVRTLAAERGIGHWPAWVDLCQDRPLGLLEDLLICNAETDPLAPAFANRVCQIMSPGMHDPYRAIAAYWARSCKDMPVSAALRWHSLMDIQDEVDLDENVVTLATIHAAKGLEWPAVRVVGMSEGCFPSSRAKTDEDLQEERRICYVALTRAKENLLLIAPAPALLPEPQASRFLGEAGLPLQGSSETGEPAGAAAPITGNSIANELGSLFA